MRGRLLAMTAGALALGLVLGLVRAEPRWNGDQGVFLSIAARILDGDRLYADVIDNKEPLFFFAHTGALWVGGWKGPAALDGFWLAVAALSIGLMLDRLRAPTPAVVTGLVAYPAALTAAWYEPGLSMLGGLAVVPLAAWLWLRGNFVASGATLAAVLLFKLNIALVAVAPLVALALLREPDGSRLRQAASALIGFATTSGAVLGVLAARGELEGFIEVLEFDLTYPDTALQVQGKSSGVASHLDVARQFFLASGKWQFPAALLALAALAGATYLGRRRGGRAFTLLAAVAVGTVVAALVSLALTAIWVHHLQMLALPAALIGVVLVSLVYSSVGRRAAAVAAAAFVLFALSASLKHDVRAGELASAWDEEALATGSTMLEQARMRFYPDAEDVSYMVFGSNSENAHAVFIDRAFDLSCRWFHLYPHSASQHLDETLACARTERPELVLVTVAFFESRGPYPAWDSFVADAGRFLDQRYEKVADEANFQVWRKSS